jgi:hypothetical protein
MINNMSQSVKRVGVRMVAVLVAAAFVMPFATLSTQVSAQAGQVPVTTQQRPAQVPITTDCDGSNGLCNPLKGVDSLGDLFYTIAKFVYSLSYAVIALFLIISGFKFVAAQGNEEKLKDAKKTFQYTIIGAILLIGANVITEVVRNVINQFSTTQI